MRGIRRAARLLLMSLRRSVIGSLRSISPFSNSNNNGIENNINNNIECISISTPRTTPILGDIDASPGQNVCPGFLKKPDTSSPAFEGTPSKMSSLRIVPSNQEPFPKFADYERDIDLVATISSRELDAQDLVFERLVRIHPAVQELVHPLFRLPTSVRRRIYSFCFPYEERKVSLSPAFATKAVFPEYYFASPWDILDHVAGGLGSFSMLRKELMVYFWTEYHFHIALNDFSGPRFSPLSHVWLIQYLSILQRITIEVDFTKFGCSQLKDAKMFGYRMSKTKHLLDSIVCGLGERHAESSIAELHLMCRRYAGFRDMNDTWVDSSKDRYCPNDVLNLCDSLIHLRGMLQQCRISGFPDAYSRELLNSMFRYGNEAPEYEIPENNAWPFAPPLLTLSEPRSLEPCTSEPPTPISLVSTEFGQLQFQQTRSFFKEMEDQMSWYSTSPKSSNYTLSPRFDDPIIPTKDEEDAKVEDDTKADESTREDGSVESEQHELHTEDHAQAYQALLPEMVFPELHLSEPSAIEVAFKRLEPPLNSTPESTTPAIPELFQPAKIGTTLRPCTPASASKSRIPRAFTQPSPSTPNKMNELNEQDPAFIRTVNAMRSLDGSSMLRHSMIASPKRPDSPGARNRTPPTKRKYMSFVNRLKGCVDGIMNDSTDVSR
ncbi:uncharacterized protein RCO7_03700 [Rhynchosporium graminicola]|uniref:Uncharacterized protein n=1 Tax=Rhynchosporium graminicola TaxID=2792576 RepID=A0A1E1LIJ0_9HELO|nr:uncharacterized protein RCO7_03700 [Rhynchosporium commune]